MDAQSQANTERSYDGICASDIKSENDTGHIEIKNEMDTNHFYMSEGLDQSHMNILQQYGPTNNLQSANNVYVPQPDWLLNMLVEMSNEIKSMKSEVSELKKEIIELKEGNKRSLTKLTEEVIAVKIENRKHHDDLILNDEYKDLPKLPLNVMEELQKFDEELKENEDKLRVFNKFIAKTGGEGPAQFLRSAVRKLISDELASSYSWRGTNIKPSAEKCFSITCIKNVCHLKYNTTDRDMNTILQKHFVHAKDRWVKRKRPN